jgi:hypothetical protein
MSEAIPAPEMLVDFDDAGSHLFVQELIRSYLPAFIGALELPNGPHRIHKIYGVADTVTKDILRMFTFLPWFPIPSVSNAMVRTIPKLIDQKPDDNFLSSPFASF